jgi:hypothetical protein
MFKILRVIKEGKPSPMVNLKNSNKTIVCSVKIHNYERIYNTYLSSISGHYLDYWCLFVFISSEFYVVIIICPCNKFYSEIMKN